MAQEFEPSRLIWDQLVLLNDAWRTYQVLYGGAADADGLLDRSARWFFQSHRRLLTREILLAISRLTDPQSMGANRNLVLATILQDPALACHASIRDRLAAEIQSVEESAAPITRHRHKYIAHLDHEVATGKAAPPPPVSREMIEGIVKGAEPIYHEYALAIGSDVSFELVAFGDANHLIRKLEDAERWRRYSRHTLQTEGRLPDEPPPAS